MAGDNLDIYDSFVSGMTFEESREFTNYAFGALSALTPPARWIRAMRTAERAFKRTHEDYIKSKAGKP